MLNREKFAKEILDIVCDGENVAVVDGKPRVCVGTPCGNCSFCGNCRGEFEDWANSEYIEPPVDWSKVPVDTPILVNPYPEGGWLHRYFAGYKDGNIYVWRNGATSWSADGRSGKPYHIAKLAESEEK